MQSISDRAKQSSHRSAEQNMQAAEQSGAGASAMSIAASIPERQLSAASKQAIPRGLQPVFRPGARGLIHAHQLSGRGLVGVASGALCSRSPHSQQ